MQPSPVQSLTTCRGMLARRRSVGLWLCSALACAAYFGCSAGSPPSDHQDSNAHSSSSGETSQTGGSSPADEEERDELSLEDLPSAEPIDQVANLDLSMPSDFIKAELGGLKLGDPIAPEATTPVDDRSVRTDPCGAVLTGVVRDFATRGNTEIGHPDFGAGVSNLTLGLVKSALDQERKPEASESFASAFIESPESFAEWYRDVPEHNMPYYLMLYLEPDHEGKVFRFQSHYFFPLDGDGEDELPGFGYEYLEHNYHFTFELHTAFLYQGGEEFSFTGDDDLWVFINGQLAIDLGGVHGEEHASVNLDEAAEKLGLQVGGTYALDFFQAERWCCDSNFAIQTSLTFTDCGFVPVIR